LYDPESLRPAFRFRLLALPIALLSLTACGIEFSSSFEGTELFKSIQLTGERRVGAELTITVMVNPVYPTPVHIGCYYEDDERLTNDQAKLDFADRAMKVGETVLEPAHDRTPADDAERIPLSFRFVVNEPGDYFIACLTPAAPDNGLGVSFEIPPP
jgi:hypothetical protein